ncbi:hypothetical protein FRB99_005908 [Tulasnella sp. 403]|nr:hypothetical protein FRB99_005908 [Tulasnella sp. 403]
MLSQDNSRAPPTSELATTIASTLSDSAPFQANEMVNHTKSPTSNALKTPESTATIKSGEANARSSDDVGDESLNAALYVATSVLQQGLDFLRDSLTAEEQLSYQSKLLPGSTIAAAISCLQTTIDDLNSVLSPEIGDGSLHHGRASNQLRSETPITLHAVTPFNQVLQTSLGRELWFVALHAIHHYAVIRTLAGELNLSVDETFGVAPSTLRYRNQEGPKAKI